MHTCQRLAAVQCCFLALWSRELYVHTWLPQCILFRDLPIFINDGVRKSIQGDMAMGDWVESIISKQAFEEGVLQFAAQWLRRSSSSTPWTWHQATNALVRDAHEPLS